MKYRRPHIFAGLEQHKYRCLLIDPPTHFSAGTKKRPQHYPRMRDREIAALDIRSLAHPEGCWICVWTTTPKIFHTGAFVTAWGAKFSGFGFVWPKLQKRYEHRMNVPFQIRLDRLDSYFFMGTGLTTRKNVEICLLFKFGKPKRLSGSVRELLIAPRREHSRKPDALYDRIEQLCSGPYAEIFARNERDEWDSAGNEVGKFAMSAA